MATSSTSVKSHGITLSAASSWSDENGDIFMKTPTTVSPHCPSVDDNDGQQQPAAWDVFTVYSRNSQVATPGSSSSTFPSFSATLMDLDSPNAFGQACERTSDCSESASRTSAFSASALPVESPTINDSVSSQSTLSPSECGSHSFMSAASERDVSVDTVFGVRKRKMNDLSRKNRPVLTPPEPMKRLHEATHVCMRCKRHFFTAINCAQHFFCLTPEEAAILKGKAVQRQEREWLQEAVQEHSLQSKHARVRDARLSGVEDMDTSA